MAAAVATDGRLPGGDVGFEGILVPKTSET